MFINVVLYITLLFSMVYNYLPSCHHENNIQLIHKVDFIHIVKERNYEMYFHYPITRLEYPLVSQFTFIVYFSCWADPIQCHCTLDSSSKCWSGAFNIYSSSFHAWGCSHCATASSCCWLHHHPTSPPPLCG